MNRVTYFVSKLQANKLVEKLNEGKLPELEGNTVLVSIDSPVTQADLDLFKAVGQEYIPRRVDSDKLVGVLKLDFHDADKPEHEQVMFDESMARKVIEFVDKHAANQQIVNFICHCEAGISRSAAVSKFIAERLGLFFPDSYMVYNRHVYRVLTNVANRMLYEDAL